MTQFQLGLVIGCFLGALVMVVALGIIQLFAEKRQVDAPGPGRRPPGKSRRAIGAWPSAHYDACNPLPFPAWEESGPEEDTTICYLSILIE